MITDAELNVLYAEIANPKSWHWVIDETTGWFKHKHHPKFAEIKHIETIFTELYKENRQKEVDDLRKYLIQLAKQFENTQNISISDIIKSNFLYNVSESIKQERMKLLKEWLSRSTINNEIEEMLMKNWDLVLEIHQNLHKSNSSCLAGLLNNTNNSISELIILHDILKQHPTAIGYYIAKNILNLRNSNTKNYDDTKDIHVLATTKLKEIYTLYTKIEKKIFEKEYEFFHILPDTYSCIHSMKDFEEITQIVIDSLEENSESINKAISLTKPKTPQELRHSITLLKQITNNKTLITQLYKFHNGDKDKILEVSNILLELDAMSIHNDTNKKTILNFIINGLSNTTNMKELKEIGMIIEQIFNRINDTREYIISDNLYKIFRYWEHHEDMFVRIIQYAQQDTRITNDKLFEILLINPNEGIYGTSEEIVQLTIELLVKINDIEKIKPIVSAATKAMRIIMFNHDQAIKLYPLNEYRIIILKIITQTQHPQRLIELIESFINNRSIDSPKLLEEYSEIIIKIIEQITNKENQEQIMNLIQTLLDHGLITLQTLEEYSIIINKIMENAQHSQELIEFIESAFLNNLINSPKSLEEYSEIIIKIIEQMKNKENKKQIMNLTQILVEHKLITSQTLEEYSIIINKIMENTQHSQELIEFIESSIYNKLIYSPKSLEEYSEIIIKIIEQTKNKEYQEQIIILIKILFNHGLITSQTLEEHQIIINKIIENTQNKEQITEITNGIKVFVQNKLIMSPKTFELVAEECRKISIAFKDKSHHIFLEISTTGQISIDDLKSIVKLCTKFPAKARAILRDIIRVGISKNIIQLPIQQEYEKILYFIENTPALSIYLYEEYIKLFKPNNKESILKIRVLFKDSEQIKEEILRGQLSKDYEKEYEELFFSIVYQMFESPDMPRDKALYVKTYKERDDRQFDIPSELQKPLKIQFSSASIILKKGSTPINTEPWNILVKITQILKDKQDQDITTIVQELLKGLKENTLKTEQEKHLTNLYQYLLNKGERLPEFRVEHNILSAYKEFLNDRVKNDILPEILREYIIKNHQEASENSLINTQQDYSGLSKQLQGILKNPQMPNTEKENIINNILQRNNFEIKGAEIITLQTDQITNWLNNNSPIQIDKRFTIQIFEELCKEILDKMNNEIEKYDIKTNMFEGEKYTIQLTKHKAHCVAMFSLGVCVAPDNEMWNSKDFWPLIIFDKDKQCQGGAILRTIEENGKKYLTISINPTGTLLNQTNPKQVLKKIIDAAKVIAKKLKYDNVIISTHSIIHSNRGSIQLAIQELYRNTQPITLSQSYIFSYNPRYTYQEFYIV